MKTEFVSISEIVEEVECNPDTIHILYGLGTWGSLVLESTWYTHARCI
ncbi:hypothetical protein Gorai_016608, partial [Gossypium raimondii]|nr:hypothetical protein [Gossypium raimondii]